MRYARDEKNGKPDSGNGKKPNLRAQARMLGGMLCRREDGKLNVRNLIAISNHFDMDDAGKTAYKMILDAGENPSTRNKVVKDLIDMLPEDADAARFLGKLKAKEAIEPLRKMARADKAYKHEKTSAAIWALGEMRVTEAIPEMINRLANPDTAETATYALLKIGEESKPALIEALSGKDSSIKEGAAKTLGKFHSAGIDAVPALKKLTGLWTRIMDRGVYKAASHAVENIQLSYNYDNML